MPVFATCLSKSIGRTFSRAYTSIDKLLPPITMVAALVTQGAGSQAPKRVPSVAASLDIARGVCVAVGRVKMTLVWGVCVKVAGVCETISHL